MPYLPSIYGNFVIVRDFDTPVPSAGGAWQDYVAVVPVLGRRGSKSSDRTADTASIPFRVVFHAADPADIPASPPDPSNLGLPSIGSSLSWLPALRLSSWDITSDADGGFSYVANYRYPAGNVGEAADAGEDKPGESGGGGGEPGPDEATDVAAYATETSRSWRGTRISTDLIRDAEDGSVAGLMPTGELTDTVPQTEELGLEFSITRRGTTFPSKFLAKDGTVNRDPVTIDGYTIPARCGRLSVEAERLYNEGPFLWQVRLTVNIRRRSVALDPTKPKALTELGHDTALMLRGFRFRPAPGAPAVRAMETAAETGEAVPTADPVLLKADGTKFDQRNAGQFAAYYKLVHVYPAAPWSENWFRPPRPAPDLPGPPGPPDLPEPPGPERNPGI